jgi:hypothetical protein
MWQNDVAGTGGVYDVVSCTATTSDSLYGVVAELYAPNDGVNCFVVGHYTFFNWNPVKDASEVYLGFIMDWDIPSDNSVDNWSGSDELLHTMWQQGAEYETDNNAACGGVEIAETDRYGGMAVLNGLDGGLLNAWAEENAPHQLGSGYDPEWLYDQMTTLSGYNNYAGDTAIDLHMGMTFGTVDMTTKASKDYWVVLVTTNEGEVDYKDQIAAANAWCLAQGFYIDIACPGCTPGDANGDGSVNVGDAVYTISYVFKGGPAPVPYSICSGDANGDCATNVGDAVYTISYVFKGGPEPVSYDAYEAACYPDPGCGDSAE